MSCFFVRMLNKIVFLHKHLDVSYLSTFISFVKNYKNDLTTRSADLRHNRQK